MKSLSRREFIKNTSLAGAGLALGGIGMTTESYGRILGANDRVNFAVIGLHGRGNAHLSGIRGCQRGQVTTICDVDRRERDRVAGQFKRRNETVKAERDFRKVLESNDVDAVTIATPEHLQSYIAISAMHAGKHVYLEKPGSHNPAEGEMVVATQKKTGKLVQFGDQQRSSPHTQEAMQKIHSGEIGKVYMGKAFYSNTRGSIGTGKKVAVPDYLDWDLWQGPAPRKPYQDNVHPYNWHWFRHWGTGESLNNGIHEVDLCLWALQVKFPRKVTATGGRYHFAG